MKKKLGLLAALATVVTVGGVYATWNYAATGISAKTTYFDTITKIAASKIDGAVGEFTVDTSNLTLLIDDTNNDHVGELVWGEKDYAEGDDGYITISLALSLAAQEEYKDTGVDIQYRLFYNEATAGSWKYDNNNGNNDDDRIFWFKDGAETAQAKDELTIKLAKEDAEKSEASGLVTWTWKVTATELQKYIYLNTIELDTEAEYTAFKTALPQGSIGFEVSAPDATI